MGKVAGTLEYNSVEWMRNIVTHRIEDWEADRTRLEVVPATPTGLRNTVRHFLKIKKRDEIYSTIPQR